jgi:hypothetical protein
MIHPLDVIDQNSVCISQHNHPRNEKLKAIPVTGRGAPYVYMMSRAPHFLNIWFTGGEVSLTRLPRFAP